MNFAIDVCARTPLIIVGVLSARPLSVPPLSVYWLSLPPLSVYPLSVRPLSVSPMSVCLQNDVNIFGNRLEFWYKFYLLLYVLKA